MGNSGFAAVPCALLVTKPRVPESACLSVGRRAEHARDVSREEGPWHPRAGRPASFLGSRNSHENQLAQRQSCLRKNSKNL